MFTVGYKGFYINGYCDCVECYVPSLGRFVSYRAAQLAITRRCRKCCEGF